MGLCGDHPGSRQAQKSFASAARPFRGRANGEARGNQTLLTARGEERVAACYCREWPHGTRMLVEPAQRQQSQQSQTGSDGAVWRPLPWTRRDTKTCFSLGMCMSACSWARAMFVVAKRLDRVETVEISLINHHCRPWPAPGPWSLVRDHLTTTTHTLRPVHFHIVVLIFFFLLPKSLWLLSPPGRAQTQTQTATLSHSLVE